MELNGTTKNLHRLWYAFLTWMVQMSVSTLTVSDKMPVNALGKPLYQSGSNVCAVFMALLTGITWGKLRSLATTGTGLNPITLHMKPAGRNGIKFDLSLDGKLRLSPLSMAELKTLPSSTIIRVINVRLSDKLVNSVYHRAHPGDVASIMAAKTIAATDNASVKPSAPETPAPVVNAPNRATRRAALQLSAPKPAASAVIDVTPKPAAKSKRKPTAKKS